jgi:predicted DNA-binding transcriptional regulator AlpA
VSIEHPLGLPHPPIKIRGTRSNRHTVVTGGGALDQQRPRRVDHHDPAVPAPPGTAAEPGNAHDPDNGPGSDRTGGAGRVPAAGPEWLTIMEVIAVLRVPRSTFYKWRTRGAGPRAVRLPNGQLRVHAGDLAAWLRADPALHHKHGGRR